MYGIVTSENLETMDAIHPPSSDQTCSCVQEALLKGAVIITASCIGFWCGWYDAMLCEYCCDFFL